MAIAGPRREIEQMNLNELSEMFGHVEVFEVPDDYGEFPDTTGYTEERWENIVLDQEDGAVFPFMTKCMDCCMEFVNKRVDIADKLGFVNIEKNVHWPKFGGKVFAVTGHVTAQPMFSTGPFH